MQWVLILSSFDWEGSRVLEYKWVVQSQVAGSMCREHWETETIVVEAQREEGLENDTQKWKGELLPLKQGRSNMHARLALAPSGPPAASPASLAHHFLLQRHPPAGRSLHWPGSLSPLLLGICSFHQACMEGSPTPLPFLHLAKTPASFKLRS